MGRLFTKKCKFLIFDIFSPSAPIETKFCTAKRTQVPVGHAKFDVNRCNESPLRGEKPDFWPVSKFNTGSLPLCGILPVTRNQKHRPKWDYANWQDILKILTNSLLFRHCKTKGLGLSYNCNHSSLITSLPNFETSNGAQYCFRKSRKQIVESDKLLVAEITFVYRATKHNVVSTYRACEFDLLVTSTGYLDSP